MDCTDSYKVSNGFRIESSKWTLDNWKVWGTMDYIKWGDLSDNQFK